MKTIETTVYNFNELLDSAKENSREWYREAMSDDDWFSDCVFEDVATIAPMLGITLKKRDILLRGGGKRQEICILYSGFSSQGDGACFEGTWNAGGVKPGKAAEHAPKDSELGRIAVEFERIAKEFPQGSFNVKHRGHYCHKYETEFDVELVPDYNDVMDAADEVRVNQAQKDLIEVARDFMGWIYKQLEENYNYSVSDEQVDESIMANGYTFTESGKRYG